MGYKRPETDYENNRYFLRNKLKTVKYISYRSEGRGMELILTKLLQIIPLPTDQRQALLAQVHILAYPLSRNSVSHCVFLVNNLKINLLLFTKLCKHKGMVEIHRVNLMQRCKYHTWSLIYNFL